MQELSVSRLNFSPLYLYHNYFIDMFAIQNETHNVISFHSCCDNYRGGADASNGVRMGYYCNI
jgi:hypothetical protein